MLNSFASPWRGYNLIDLSATKTKGVGESTAYIYSSHDIQRQQKIWPEKFFTSFRRITLKVFFLGGGESCNQINVTYSSHDNPRCSPSFVASPVGFFGNPRI